MSYKKPLLIEVYVDVRLDVGQLDDTTSLAVVERLRGVGLSEIEIVFGANAAVAENAAVNVGPRIRCWSSDRTKLAQVGRDQVIANQIGDYLGWRKFLEHFHTVLRATGDRTVASVALHTIDRLDVAFEGYTLGRYFSCDGGWIPKAFSNYSEPCDISFGHGYLQTDGFNRSLKLQQRAEGERRTVRIDAVFHEVLEGSSLPEKLEKLHTDGVTLFEQLITDETRKIMGGKV